MPYSKKRRLCYIIDAGGRRNQCAHKDVMQCIGYMLGHDLNGTFSRSTLLACFITHPHDDHTNMIIDIMSDANILKSNDFKVFLGGLANQYEQILVDRIIAFTPKALLKNNIYNFGTFQIRAFDVNSSLDYASDNQAINRFGAVIGLAFANRKIAFLGDIDNDGFKAICSTRFGEHIIGQSSNAHPMCNFLLSADIVTAPHHGLLNNAEGYIYKTLLIHKQDRIFLVSGNPNDPHLPIQSDILVDIHEAATVFLHNISLANIYFNHQIKNFVIDVSTQASNKPLFSTHDAPYGFIWTRIEQNGNISIHDGARFRLVRQ